MIRLLKTTCQNAWCFMKITFRRKEFWSGYQIKHIKRELGYKSWLFFPKRTFHSQQGLCVQRNSNINFCEVFPEDTYLKWTRYNSSWWPHLLTLRQSSENRFYNFICLYAGKMDFEVQLTHFCAQRPKGERMTTWKTPLKTAPAPRFKIEKQWFWSRATVSKQLYWSFTAQPKERTFPRSPEHLPFTVVTHGYVTL